MQSAVPEKGKFRVLTLERTGKIIYFTNSLLQNFKCLWCFLAHEFSIPQGIQKKKKKKEKEKRACDGAQISDLRTTNTLNYANNPQTYESFLTWILIEETKIDKGKQHFPGNFSIITRSNSFLLWLKLCLPPTCTITMWTTIVLLLKKQSNWI